MNTRRLTTILTSAYVSAMLASSVAPIRSDATLAATIDPMAAQKALQSAVSGLDALGWLAASAASPAVVQPTPKITPNNPPPKTDPIMTDELMARLIKFTRVDPAIGSMPPRVCAILDLCDGSKDMALAMAKGDRTDFEHYFTMPLGADSKNIILVVVHNPHLMYLYLTDKTGKLRAAVTSDEKSVRLIMNEKAAEAFKAELSMWAGEALTLPPAGAAAAGNS
jgi:hypothetical protein